MQFLIDEIVGIIRRCFSCQSIFTDKEKLMLSDVFTRASVRTKLAAGPAGPYLKDLAAALRQQRYATHTIQKYLHAADGFGRWLTTEQLTFQRLMRK